MNLSKFKKLLFGVSGKEITYNYRGFVGGNNNTIARIELVGQSFVYGYHAALESNSHASLSNTLNAVDYELKGFAYEGAGMGLSLLDYLTPWNNNRFNSFVTDYGKSHLYMMYVGFGWAIARLPFYPLSQLKKLDPVLRWLAVDGFGFHEGFFNTDRYLGKNYWPKKITGYYKHAFDQGLGRSLWFSNGLNVDLIIETINTFDSSRHSDIWSGIGLAATYAGGVDNDTLIKLVQAAKKFLPELAQGASFAAKARLIAGNLVPATNDACDVFCGTEPVNAAKITDDALININCIDEIENPKYEIWRKNIQHYFKLEFDLLV